MATDKALNRLIGLGTAGAAATAAYVWLIRPWHTRWGATPEETARPLPGDELVPQPKQTSTRAITIQASTAEVWPWLVQMGQGRGGLYSYEGLENLLGCHIHNTDRILPEFQQLSVGDRVQLGPAGYPFYTVAVIEPQRALVLRAGDPKHEPAPIEESWTFYLEEITPGATRLIVRDRRSYQPTLADFITWRVITEPLHFIMERRMLWGIKERAEIMTN